MFHEFMTIVNLVFRKFIAWPMGTKPIMWWKTSSNGVGCLACTKQWWHPHHNFLTYFLFSKINIIIQQKNIPLLFKSLLIVTKHFLMFLLDCRIMLMIPKFYVGLLCVVVVNIKFCFILTKVWKVLVCICWRMRDMGFSQLHNTRRNLIFLHYPNSLSF